jgi:radical SAM protein with 4Fe4S-binding SPASM domain
MIDIDFYMKVHHVTKKILEKECFDRKYIIDLFNQYRNLNPVIYNIETTNACNMKCKMCPRTTRMTRKVETMGENTFINILNQINPFSREKWQEWENFIISEYNIMPNDMSENHFFLYIIPKVIQLHGFGDPLLDNNMGKYINLLFNKGLDTYFSCNPANINLNKTEEMFANGLNYIKYSIESTDDEIHKKIRGDASDFTNSYKDILDVINIKEKNNYKTTIIITMLDLNRANQIKDFEILKSLFNGMDVYIYLKSEDQQWYRKDCHGTKSVHWTEFCKHPWMSMSIKSNGDVAMCMEDYNNEIILGNVNNENLYNIWNGKKYEEFRNQHFFLDSSIKCTKECDMNIVGDFLTTNKCWCGNAKFSQISKGIWASGIPTAPFNLIKCSTCNTKLINNFVAPEYENHEIDGYGPLSPRYIDFISIIEKFLLPGSMFEIGCGAGNLLNYFHNKHKITKIKGTDLNFNSIAVADIELDLEVKSSFKEFGKYNNIILNHCLEHIENIIEVLEDLKKNISDTGTNLYICVPNMESAWAKEDIYSFPAFSPDEHFWHFSIKTLTKLITTVFKAKILYSGVGKIWRPDDQIKLVAHVEK